MPHRSLSILLREKAEARAALGVNLQDYDRPPTASRLTDNQTNPYKMKSSAEIAVLL
jgi:hypothetical protein